MHFYLTDNFKPEVILRNATLCNASQEGNLLLFVSYISAKGQNDCIFTCVSAFLLDRVVSYLQQ